MADPLSSLLSPSYGMLNEALLVDIGLKSVNGGQEEYVLMKWREYRPTLAVFAGETTPSVSLPAKDLSIDLV